MNKSYVETEKLRIERLKKNLTLKNMANLLGFKSAATYYNIEKGKTNPKVSILVNISNILEKPVEYFLQTKFNKNEQI